MGVQFTLRNNETPLGPARPSHSELIERLFREHNEALVRFLLARLRSRQAALEVAQEAYVRLLSLDQPGAVSYLRSFLFKTAANLESGLFAQVGAALSMLGHEVVAANGDEMGGFQAIQFMPYEHEAQTSARVAAGSGEQPINGVYRGASDHRKDGEAVGW
jgi:hypothetical protein